MVGSVDFNENHTEITATQAGRITGNFYLGDSGEIKKTFYIIVEENVGNAPLETIILKLDNDIVINNPSTPSSTTPKPIQTPKNTQISTEKLPQTGTTSTLITIIGIVIIISIILGLKLKKYKDIK